MSDCVVYNLHIGHDLPAHLKFNARPSHTHAHTHMHAHTDAHTDTEGEKDIFLANSHLNIYAKYTLQL